MQLPFSFLFYPAYFYLYYDKCSITLTFSTLCRTLFEFFIRFIPALALFKHVLHLLALSAEPPARPDKVVFIVGTFEEEVLQPALRSLDEFTLVFSPASLPDLVDLDVTN